jgi:hypothetical protein
MSAKVFAVGGWNTPLSDAGHVHRGTQLRVTLNRAATLVVVVKRLAHGRVVGGKCVPATHKNRHARSCKRKTEKMRLTRNAHAGKNPIHFSGRSDGKVLNPGPFLFVVHAEKDGQRSEARTLHFRIVRG